MKIKGLLFGMLATVALAGCSSDEVMEKEDNPVLNGKDKAYLAIQLVNPVGIGSRGTGDSENPFYYGTPEENEVNSADFYFYRADGTFDQKVTKALSWTDNGNDTPTTNNVESVADAVIVLQGLKEKNAPKYVIAVLNDGDPSFEEGDLSSTATLTTDYMNGDYFVMTNSTTNNNTDETGKYYATIIDQSKFLNEAPNMDELTDENAVQIYVERLAAKVKLTLDSEITDAASETGLSIGTYKVDGADKDIKIKITGWGLSGTNKSSYYMKKVENFNAIGTWDWNHETNHRSYWGQSANTYGSATATYPTSYRTSVEAGNEYGGEGGDITFDQYTLNYPNAEQLKVPVGSAAYCAENTNTAEQLATNLFNKVTHILVKAQIVGDADLIRYEGTLYSKDNFIARVLNTFNLKVYTLKENSTTEYRLFGETDIKIEDIKDGHVTIELTDEAANKDWVTGTIKDDDTFDGEPTPVDVVSTITSRIESVDVDAEYYTKGVMYYNIPIEHLANVDMDESTVDKEMYVFETENGNGITKFKTAEGNYGVVRNHYYNVTINKIERLGTSVFNPDEPIIVPVKTPSYYIGAKMYILSWRVVNQGVDL